MPWVEPAGALAASVLNRGPQQPARSFVVTGLNGAGRSRVLVEARRFLEHDSTTVLTFTPTGGSATWVALDNNRRDDALWDEHWREILSTTDLTVLWAHQDLLPVPALERLRRIVEKLPPVLFLNPGIKSPFTVAKAFGINQDITQRFRTRDDWDDVDELVESYAPRLPTYVVQLDNLDDYFDNEPQLMLTVQAALTRQLLRRAARHTTAVVQACVRSTVREYWLRRSGTDLTDNPSFLEMTWTDDSLRRFVSTFLDSQAEHWTGPPLLCERDEIDNPARGVVEPLGEYLLRHTFLTPADVQRMLRYVCGKRGERDRPLTVDAVKAAVNNQATASADTFIHQLVSDLRGLPATHAVPDQDSVKVRLKESIAAHGTELVSSAALQDIASQWADPTSPFLMDGLWRQRLLTVCGDSDDQRYCSATATDRLDSNKQLAFHPALIDLCHLVPAPGGFRLGYL